MSNQTKRMNIALVLDESGSMSSMGVEPVESANNLINGQLNDSLDGTFSMFTFSNRLRCIMKKTPIDSIPKITQNMYRPEGGTALCDAICTVIHKLDNDDNTPCVLIIITDGNENSSVMFNGSDVKKRVADVESRGWKVILVGANIDALKTGGEYNISHGRCSEFDQSIEGNLTDLCREISNDVADFRRCVSMGDPADLLISNSENLMSVSLPSDGMGPMPSNEMGPIPSKLIRSNATYFYQDS
jgi:uncharacterized protein YegL